MGWGVLGQHGLVSDIWAIGSSGTHPEHWGSHSDGAGPKWRLGSKPTLDEAES